MIDHTQLCVAAQDHKATVAFYEEVLKPMGYEKLLVFGPNQEAVGFGDRGISHHQMHTEWWIVSTPNQPAKTHHAFRCKDRATVDAFHAAAIAAGGNDNGKPGVRSHYHANYYGAFIIDPAGNNIEAVCHEPQ